MKIQNNLSNHKLIYVIERVLVTHVEDPTRHVFP